MRRGSRIRLGLIALLAQFALSGCFGGPCSDPTAMILLNFVIPGIIIGTLIYYRVTRD